jgi:hypothetical protein
MMAHCQRLALVVILLYPYLAGAAVQISAKNRMRNRPPGRCGWCAVETLARHHHFKSLYGLTKKHASRCSAEDLEEALTEGHVTYRIQYPGKRSKKKTEILRSAIENGQGAAVGFHGRRKGKGGHIVTLVDWGDKQVRLIDSSDPQLRIRTMSKKKFLSYWDGFALVLDKVEPHKIRGHAVTR